MRFDRNRSPQKTSARRIGAAAAGCWLLLGLSVVGAQTPTITTIEIPASAADIAAPATDLDITTPHRLMVQVQPAPAPAVPGVLADPIPMPAEPIQSPRLESLPAPPAPFAATPHPTPEVKKEFDRFVDREVDPQETLDLVLNRPRVMVLKLPPKRVQIPDETVATYNVLSETQIAVVGKRTGSTVLNLWFADPQNPNAELVLSYLVRVIPDPEAKQRQEQIYSALADEINESFPNSHVELSLVGDKLVVKGEAKDILEAQQIIMVIAANQRGGQGGLGGQGGGGQGGAQMANMNIPIGAGGMFPTNQASVDDNLIAGQLGVDAPGAPGVNAFILQGGRNIINLLRIPGEQQVMLKVSVAEVNRTAARSIGLNFSIANKAGQFVFGNFTGGLLSTSTTGGANALAQTSANLPAAIDNGQILLAIQALRTLNLARSLAEPNVVAINGQTAQFQAGGEFPVPNATATFGAVGQSVTFVPFGVSLTFIPYITDRDRIRLQLFGRVSTTDASLGATVGGTSVPGLQARTFRTTLEMREGQTLAMAGLIQNNLTSSSNRVPFFGDLPLVGHLAGFDQTSNQEFELVVLITPQLVHPLEHDEITPLPGADMFEPGDIEFFLLTRLESRRQYDFRSPVRTDLARIMRYEHCEDIYILGPHGHSKQPATGSRQ